MIFLYDMTRLIEITVKRLADRMSYTGIDRVDLEYANYLYQNKNKNTIFVYQYQDGFEMLTGAKIEKFFKVSRSIMSSTKSKHIKYNLYDFFKKPSTDKNINKKNFFEKLLLKVILLKIFIRNVCNLVKSKRKQFIFLNKDKLYSHCHNKFVVNASSFFFIHFPEIIHYFLCFLEDSLSKFIPKKKMQLCWTDELLNNKKIKQQKIFYLNCSHYGLSNKKQFIWLLSRLPVKPIFFIHDLIPITHPEFVVRNLAKSTIIALENLNQFGEMIFFNSHDSKETFIMLSKKFEIFNPALNLQVNSLGVDNNFINNELPDVKSRYIDKIIKMTKGNYFTYTSTIEPRKNHSMLLNLWIRECLKMDWPYLLIIGRSGWRNENIMDLLEKACELGKVIHLPFVSDNDLRHLIINSRATLFCSFAEGWGIPIAESLSLGKPVICSDISVFKELFNKTAQFVDPIDTESWKKLILEYSKKDSLALKDHEEIVQKEFKHFTWRQHFKIFEKNMRGYN